MVIIMKRISLFVILLILLSTLQTSLVAAKKKTADKPTAAPVIIDDAPKVKMDSQKPKTWSPELKVGLYTLNAPFTVSTNLESVITDTAKKKKIKTLKKDSEIDISVKGNEIQIDGTAIGSSEIEIRPTVETELKIMQTKINGKDYFGGLRVVGKNNNLVVINILTVEEYLRGVLPKEVTPSWNEEALKAQAVAARTFALKNRDRHKNEGYDLCSTVHCQAYDGIEWLHDRTDKAISDTFGEVLYYNGKLIEASFHTDSGGMTENSLDVWGTDYPYLRSVTEIKTKTLPWDVWFTFEQFSKKLKDSGHDIGEAQFIKVTNLEIGKLTDDRSASGRVKEITIIGTAGEIKLTGSEMRSIFGLKSTLFDVGINGEAFKISGYGWGHGVGLSQYGAKEFADHGYTYDKILAHYYKGTTLNRLY